MLGQLQTSYVETKAIKRDTKVQYTFHATHQFTFEEDWEKMKLSEKGRQKLESQNTWQIGKASTAIF